MATRVMLADDHALFAQALSHLLAQRYEVVDVLTDGQKLLAAVRQHRPDVVVADITMPLMSGMESVRSLLKESHLPKVVFLTMHADPQLAQECIKCGGKAFVTKECGFDELVQAIDAVMANQVYLSPGIAAGVIETANDSSTSRTDFERLTWRQRQILQLLAEGKSMKEVASMTNLSTRTIEWHKYGMMRTLGLKRSVELVQYAVRMKLVA